jgi:hypothetical protein
VLFIDRCCAAIYQPISRTQLNSAPSCFAPARHSGAGIFHFQVQHEGGEHAFAIIFFGLGELLFLGRLTRSVTRSLLLKLLRSGAVGAMLSLGPYLMVHR